MVEDQSLPSWLQEGLGAVSGDPTAEYVALLIDLHGEVVRGEGAEKATTAAGTVRPPDHRGHGAVRASAVDGHLVIEVANVQPTAPPWLVIEGADPIPLELFEGTLQAVVPLSVIEHATVSQIAADLPSQIGLLWPS